MPDPINVIYTPYYKIALEEITKRLPFAHYIQTSGLRYKAGIIKVVINDFKKCITFNSNKIFIVTSHKINTYLNDFSVLPRGAIDEFKTIFFLTQTIAEFLERDGLNTVSKVALISMAWILDYRLYTVNARRKTLTKNITKIINNGSLLKKTGEVGLYLIYKCLYNQTKDKLAQ